MKTEPELFKMGCGQFPLEAHRGGSSPQKPPNGSSGEKRGLGWDSGDEAVMGKVPVGCPEPHAHS